MLSPVILFLSLALTILPFSIGAGDAIKNRVDLLSLIGAEDQALQELKDVQKEMPDSLAIQEVYLRLLAQQGKESQVIQEWVLASARFPALLENHDLLENLAWLVIKNGANSSQVSVRISALLASVFTQDVTAIPILLGGIRSSQQTLKSLAIQLAPYIRGKELEEAMIQELLLRQHRDIKVAALYAIAQMQLKDQQDLLEGFLQDERISMEEKHAAIFALLSFSDQVSLEKLNDLASSSRYSLRRLACEYARFSSESTVRNLLVSLSSDPVSEVRFAAVYALGQLRSPVPNLFLKLSQERDKRIAYTAAWALVLYESEKGLPILQKGLQDPEASSRLFSAAALAATGKYGVDVMLAEMQTHNDPYVRVNLALALLGQQVAIDQSCQIIADFLEKEKDAVMWNRELPFEQLAPSTIRHQDAIPNAPEVFNQATRLDLLLTLIHLDYPGSLQSLKAFLQGSFWGIQGLAALQVLKEGDEKAVDLVRALLETESDPVVRFQAALLLSGWSKDKEAIIILEDYYDQATRNQKVQILEAFSKLAIKSTIPFLFQRLQDPSQVLRIFAASALIQCINH